MAKLKFDKEGTLKSEILDAEGDPIKCVFHGDEGVELKVKKYSYLSLSRDNLLELINLIDAADVKYLRGDEE